MHGSALVNTYLKKRTSVLFIIKKVKKYFSCADPGNTLHKQVLNSGYTNFRKHSVLHVYHNKHRQKLLNCIYKPRWKRIGLFRVCQQNSSTKGQQNKVRYIIKWLLQWIIRKPHDPRWIMLVNTCVDRLVLLNLYSIHGA